MKSKILIFGIQGGRGSFSEQALLRYAKIHGRKNYRVQYLFTSERVLRALNQKDIDYGLLAVKNAAGGSVSESNIALKKYPHRTVGKVTILVRHFLMYRKDASISTPLRIMAHDQVFKQCIKTLARRYPRAKLITGKGNLIDTARAAQDLAAGRLPKDTFILGPLSLAKLYGLKIVAGNLQDIIKNYTTFLIVSRR